MFAQQSLKTIIFIDLEKWLKRLNSDIAYKVAQL